MDSNSLNKTIKEYYKNYNILSKKLKIPKSYQSEEILYTPNDINNQKENINQLLLDIGENYDFIPDLPENHLYYLFPDNNKCCLIDNNTKCETEINEDYLIRILKAEKEKEKNIKNIKKLEEDVNIQDNSKENINEIKIKNQLNKFDINNNIKNNDNLNNEEIREEDEVDSLNNRIINELEKGNNQNEKIDNNEQYQNVEYYKPNHLIEDDEENYYKYNFKEGSNEYDNI